MRTATGLALTALILFCAAQALGDVTEEWARTHQGPGGGHDWSRAIAMDDSGCVCVTGKSRDLGINDDLIVIGCSQDNPVEKHFCASDTEAGSVLLERSIPSLAGIEGLNVYRATSPSGPFARVNDGPLDPASVGEFEDATVRPGTTFWYELRAVLAGCIEDVVEPGLECVTTSGTLALNLYPPRPDPSSGGTTLWFDTPNDTCLLSLAVYNVRGELVKTLVNGRADRGRHEKRWDGTDEAGHAVSAGAYFVRLETGEDARTGKVLVIR